MSTLPKIYHSSPEAEELWHKVSEEFARHALEEIEAQFWYGSFPKPAPEEELFIKAPPKGFKPFTLYWLSEPPRTLDNETTP